MGLDLEQVQQRENWLGNFVFRNPQVGLCPERCNAQSAASPINKVRDFAMNAERNYRLKMQYARPAIVKILLARNIVINVACLWLLESVLNAGMKTRQAGSSAATVEKALKAELWRSQTHPELG